MIAAAQAHPKHSSSAGRRFNESDLLPLECVNWFAHSKKTE